MSKLMVKLSSVLLVCCMLSTMVPVASAANGESSDILTVTDNGSTVYYMITDAEKKEVEVCSQYAPGYESPSSYTGEITIPASITVDSKTYSVIGVGAGAFESSTVTKVTLPNSIKYIGSSAFWKAAQLTGVSLPNGLETISDAAFQECSNLVTLSIPSTVTEIGSYAFYRCTSLTSLTIPSGVTEIKDQAFFGCTSLSDLTISGSVTSIGTKAFVSCPASSLTIPDTVTQIGTAAFLGCGAESLAIPGGVTEGVADALLGYENVDKITFAEGSPYKIDNGVLYHGTVLESVLDRGITALVVLPGTTEIASQVCASVNGAMPSTGGVSVAACEDLVTVVIPESVTKIGTNAFNGALKKAGSTLIMMGETPPAIVRLWTRPNVPTTENLTVIVPAGSESNYSADGSVFKTYITTTEDGGETTKGGISYKLDMTETVSIINGETGNLGTAIVPTGWTLSVEPSSNDVVTISGPDENTGAVTATVNSVGTVTVKFSIKNETSGIVLAEQTCKITVTVAPAAGYGVSYDAKGYGYASATLSKTDEDGKIGVLPTVSDVVLGATFLGWSTDGTKDNIVDATFKTDKDVTLTAVYQGYMAGYEDGTAKPARNVTRGELARMLVVASGKYDADKDYGKPSYSDAQNGWYVSYIACAEDLGILHGDGNAANTVRPNAPVTREEASIMIANAFGVSVTDGGTTDKVTDFDKVASWAQDYVAALCNNGTITGYEDRTFRGQRSIQRAEAAQMINKYLGLTEADKDAIEADTSIVSPFSDVKTKDWTYANIMFASLSVPASYYGTEITMPEAE